MDDADYHLWNPFTEMEQFLKNAGFGANWITSGDGVTLTNSRGETVINGCSSLWNVAVGLGREELVEAATRQMRHLAFSSHFRQPHPRAIELPRTLVEIAAGPYQRAYLGSNGSEAVEAALKITRQFWRQGEGSTKYKVLSLKYSYHGVSYGAISTSGRESDQSKYGPLLEGFEQIEPPYCYRCPYGKSGYPDCGLACAGALEEKIEKEGPDTVAAFILEPIMGVYGMITPPMEYYKAVGEICRRHNVLLIADEVTTGFGRTGKLFETQEWDPRPDILVLGKGISSGYLPLSATLVSERIYRRFLGQGNQLEHGSTASGHPVCAAVGLANIELILTHELPQKAARAGARLRQGVEALRETSQVVGEVRGRGLMLGVELVANRETREPLSPLECSRHMSDLVHLGLLAFKTENALALLPPLVLEDETVDEILAILKKGLATGAAATIGRRARVVRSKAKSLVHRESPDPR